MAEGNQAVFGIQQEWQASAENHSEFLGRFDDLHALLRSVFIRDGKTSDPVDRAVFFLGRLMVEDFMAALRLTRVVSEIGLIGHWFRRTS